MRVLQKDTNMKKIIINFIITLDLLLVWEISEEGIREVGLGRGLGGAVVGGPESEDRDRWIVGSMDHLLKFLRVESF